MQLVFYKIIVFLFTLKQLTLTNLLIIKTNIKRLTFFKLCKVLLSRTFITLILLVQSLLGSPFLHAQESSDNEYITSILVYDSSFRNTTNSTLISNIKAKGFNSIFLSTKTVHKDTTPNAF